MRFEDLNEYYDNLCDTFDRGEMDFVMNHDRAHNAVIECFMLNKSNVINMYCGEMSVFREGFYNHINQDSNYDLKEGETALGDEIKKKVIKSLREFINRPNVSLNIYFERFDRKFLRDLIDLRVFSDGVSSEKMAHVSYTDTNIVRMERNPQTHEATCAINPPEEILSKVKATFKSMSLVGEEIKLN